MENLKNEFKQYLHTEKRLNKEIEIWQQTKSKIADKRIALFTKQLNKQTIFICDVFKLDIYDFVMKLNKYSENINTGNNTIMEDPGLISEEQFYTENY